MVAPGHQHVRTFRHYSRRPEHVVPVESGPRRRNSARPLLLSFGVFCQRNFWQHRQRLLASHGRWGGRFRRHLWHGGRACLLRVSQENARASANQQKHAQQPRHVYLLQSRLRRRDSRHQQRGAHRWTRHGTRRRRAPPRRTRLSLVGIFSAAALIGSAAVTKHLRAGVAELTSIRLLIAQGKNSEAITELQQLTAREPQFAAAQDLLASLYLSGGDYPKAISAFEKANAADPANPTYQRQLGTAYLATKQYDQAIAFFQKLVRASPSDSRNFLGLGYSYAGLQQYDSAISAFSQAVTLDPKSPAPQFALGQAQLKAGRFTDAQATYRRLLKEYPNDSRARAALHFASRQPH